MYALFSLQPSYAPKLHTYNPSQFPQHRIFLSVWILDVENSTWCALRFPRSGYCKLCQTALVYSYVSCVTFVFATFPHKSERDYYIFTGVQNPMRGIIIGEMKPSRLSSTFLMNGSVIIKLWFYGFNLGALSFFFNSPPLSHIDRLQKTSPQYLDGEPNKSSRSIPLPF